MSIYDSLCRDVINLVIICITLIKIILVNILIFFFSVGNLKSKSLPKPVVLTSTVKVSVNFYGLQIDYFVSQYHINFRALDWLSGYH